MTSTLRTHAAASAPASPSRRRFIVNSALAGGGLAIGLQFPISELFGEGTAAGQTVTQAATDIPEVNAWVVIKPDGTCVIRIVRSEMGQGTLTGLAQLVAEELECDWAKVTTEMPTPGQSHARKRVWGEFSTGGSRGIRVSQDYVRRGGAAARIMLMQAAAAHLGVPAGELTVSEGVIRHPPSGLKVSYGRVAAAAAKLAPPDPESITLKDPNTWTIAGKPLKRLDTAAKLNGSKVYAIDLRLPGMLSAAIRQCPVFGGKLVSFDESKIAGRPGVRKVFGIHGNAVVVVADHWWHAKTALDALPVVWDFAGNDKHSSETINAHLRDGLKAADAYKSRDEGNAPEAIARAAKLVEAVYATPFLAHAPMEMMNCTARITADRAEVWVPTQNGEASMAALSEESGLPLDKCEVYKMDLGGGFGRRGGNQDYTRQAVAVAKQFPGVPVKLVWSREEDTQHDFYRPVSQCRMEAGLDASGRLLGLHIRVSGQSINAFANPGLIKDGKDERQLQGFWARPGDAQLGYTFPSLRLEYAMRNTHVPVGTWRGVNTNQNAVYMECFLDEVAHAAGADPLEFRRSLMQKHPKHLAVLNAAAEKAGWGKPLPHGRHRGIAQFMGYGSYSAAVAEVSVSGSGRVKVHRMVLALNCGHAVNPQQIEAQVQGSVVFGLTATFYGECTVDKGRIVQSNFHDYRSMKLAQMPKVETVIVPSYDFWGGVGEPTICVVAPSVINAIVAATGEPQRSLPLKHLTLA